MLRYKSNNESESQSESEREEKKTNSRMVRWISRKVWGKPNEIAFSCLNRSFGWWYMSGSVWLIFNKRIHAHISHRITSQYAFHGKGQDLIVRQKPFEHETLFIVCCNPISLTLSHSFFPSLSFYLALSHCVCVFAFFLNSLFLKGECEKKTLETDPKRKHR